jgi:hypothetical protein
MAAQTAASEAQVKVVQKQILKKDCDCALFEARVAKARARAEARVKSELLVLAEAEEAKAAARAAEAASGAEGAARSAAVAGANIAVVDAEAHQQSIKLEAAVEAEAAGTAVRIGQSLSWGGIPRVSGRW